MIASTSVRVILKKKKNDGYRFALLIKGLFCEYHFLYRNSASEGNVIIMSMREDS